MVKETLKCPVCGHRDFLIKYEATYVYSYVVDSNAPGLRNDYEFLPFMFDNREQKETKQFIECHTCRTKFPCYFNHLDRNIGLDVLQNAISQENILQV